MIGLAMMVRDGAQNLERCLRSVDGLVDGPLTFVDVGSTDDTPEIAARWGELHRREWSDFATNATETLAIARERGGCDYLLVLSENDVVTTHTPLPDVLDAPSYMIQNERAGVRFRIPCLLRSDVDWRYVGRVHSVLEPDFFAERRPLDSFTVESIDDDGRRDEKSARYLAELEQMHADDPSDARTVFYLAQHLRLACRFDEASAMYERRIMLGGWDEEVFYAHYMKGVCLLALERWEEGRATLLGAYLRRPSRAEPLMALCRSMLPPDDILFLEPACYGTVAA